MLLVFSIGNLLRHWKVHCHWPADCHSIDPESDDLVDSLVEANDILLEGVVRVMLLQRYYYYYKYEIMINMYDGEQPHITDQRISSMVNWPSWPSSTALQGRLQLRPEAQRHCHGKLGYACC